MNDLMLRKNFISHAGLNLTWKLEADSISDETWEAAAMIVASEIHFTHVKGIPRGGVKFAIALERYAHKTPTHKSLLIVDDVLTTGKSMEEAYQLYGPEFDYINGAVLFARGRCPSWIYPVWQIGEKFVDKKQALVNIRPHETAPYIFNASEQVCDSKVIVSPSEKAASTAPGSTRSSDW